MNYVMKAGNLYLKDVVQAYIRSTGLGPKKKIFSASGKLVMCTDIRNPEVSIDKIGNVRLRQYIMLDEEGKERVIAKPDYAKGEDPNVFGWPLCRMPRMDHAEILMDGEEYFLVMKNSQGYILSEKRGQNLIRIFHKGLAGGWDIEAMDDFSPEVVCGIFIFCKYIEQENEFWIV